MNTPLRRLLILLFILISASAHSQTQGVLGKKFFDNWSVGVGGGPNIFFGDLKAKQFFPVSYDMNEWKFAGTFTLTKQLSHVFALRGQFLYSEISGTKRFYTDGSPANEYFDGNILEGNINGTMNLTNLFARKYNPKQKFFVYMILGAGTSSYITNVKQLYTGKPLRVSDTLGNWTTVLMAMGGFGVHYSFGEKVNLGIEWTLHGVNTDKLDVTKALFKYDAYSLFSLNITYNFNKYNPGKAPDTNANKIYVPVYIQVPVKETKPVDTLPPPVVKKVEPVVDTVPEISELPAEPDSVSVFKELPETGSFYRVQIFAFKNEKYTTQEVKAKYHFDLDVTKDFSDGWYRYMVGSFDRYEDAKAFKAKMRKKGFRDAFITRYDNGTRVERHGRK